MEQHETVDSPKAVEGKVPVPSTPIKPKENDVSGRRALLKKALIGVVVGILLFTGGQKAFFSKSVAIEKKQNSQQPTNDSKTDTINSIRKAGGIIQIPGVQSSPGTETAKPPTQPIGDTTVGNLTPNPEIQPTSVEPSINTQPGAGIEIPPQLQMPENQSLVPIAGHPLLSQGGKAEYREIETSLAKSSFVAINVPGKGTTPSVKLAVQPGTEVSATIRQKIFPAVGSWVIAELSQPAGSLPAGTRVIGQIYESNQNRAYVSFSRAVVSGGMVEIAAVVRDGKDGADGLPLKAPREVMKGVMRGFRAASGLVPFGAQIGQAVTALQQSESSYGFGYANGAQPVRNWNSGKVKLIFLEEQPAKQNRDFDLDFLNQPNFGTQNPFGQPVFPQGYGQGNPILANQPYGAQPGVLGTQPGIPTPVPAGTYPVFPNQPPPQFPTQRQGGR